MTIRQPQMFVLFSIFLITCSIPACSCGSSSAVILCEKCLDLCMKTWNNTPLRALCRGCAPRCSGHEPTLFLFFSQYYCNQTKTEKGSGFIPFEQFQPIAHLFSIPTTPTTPTPNVEPEDLEGSCRRFHRAMSNAFRNFIVNSYQTCSATLKFERERLKNCTIKSRSSIQSEEAIMEVYKSRLTNSTSVERLLEEPSSNDTTERSRLVATRIFAEIRVSQATNQEICSTRMRVISPSTVKHPSGVDVYLWAPPGKRQLFFVRECKSSRPLVGLSSGVARCSMVNNLHKALFVYERARNSGRVPFSGCTRISRKGSRKSKYVSYICDDWVLLPTFCSLFMLHNNTNDQV